MGEMFKRGKKTFCLPGFDSAQTPTEVGGHFATDFKRSKIGFCIDIDMLNMNFKK